MVDIDPEEPDELRFVVFPAPTLASTTLIQVSAQTLKAHLFTFQVPWHAFFSLAHNWLCPAFKITSDLSADAALVPTALCGDRVSKQKAR